MMTINAAKALRLEDRLGSIEAGKRADIVIRNDATPEAWPRINMERQQLLLARSRSVDTVIVDGRVVLRGGRTPSSTRRWCTGWPRRPRS